MQKLRRVVVSGMGLVTPAGCGVQTTWSGLLGSKGFLRYTTKEDNLDIELLGKAIGGMLPEDLSSEFWSSKLEERDSALAPLLCSATEALDGAGWMPTTVHDQERCGIILSTSEARSRHILDELRSQSEPGLASTSRNAFLRTHKGFVCGQIAKLHHYRGPVRIIASACASGHVAIGNAFRMIQEGEADVILVASAVGSPETFSLASMLKLGATSALAEDPEAACRPFDESRSGAIFSQAGAAIVVEELSHAQRRKAKIHCEVRGFSAVYEGKYPLQPMTEGEGFVLTMKRAVEEDGLLFEDIGLVRTHATGSKVGDLLEAISIDKCFGNHKPVVSTGKGHIGHSGECAGIVESVLGIMCIKNNIVPPIRNLKKPLAMPEGKTLNFAQEITKKQIKAAVVNGAGFGGICASVVYSKYKENN